MSRILLLALMSFIVSASLKSQIFFNSSVDTFSQGKLDSIMEQSFRLKDSFDLINYGILRMDIFKVRNGIFLLPDGRFDVFEWKNGRWHNRCESIYFGYNFYSKKFVYKDDLYSFGGYGLWRYHGDLIKFMWNQNNWSFISYDEEKKQGYGLSYLYNEKLHIVDPFLFINIYRVYEGKSFAIDMRSLETYPISLSLNSYFGPTTTTHFVYTGVIETDKYLAILGAVIYIIDKKTQNLYSEKSKNDFLDALKIVFYRYFSSSEKAKENYFIHVRNDSVSIFDTKLKLRWEFDIEKEIANFALVKNDKPYHPNIIIFAGVLMILTASIYLIYKRNGRKKDDEDEYQYEQVHEIIKLRGTTLSVEELDQILGIQDIFHAETQRYKRAQMINAINQQSRLKTGKELISRIQDPIDKRRFLYKINES